MLFLRYFWIIIVWIIIALQNGKMFIVMFELFGLKISSLGWFSSSDEKTKMLIYI